MRRVNLLPRSLVVVFVALAAVLMAAPPSFAAPALDISAHQNLKDGQSVTISGSGFKPGLKGIAIGQCRKGYVGPGDCNLQGGAVFRDADAGGKVAQFTIVVKEKFGNVDCTTEECVLAAGPLPTAADAATVKANTWEVTMTFGAAPAAAPAAPAPAAPSVAPSTEAAPVADTGTLPKTGAGDSVPVLLLGATALLGTGVAVMLLVPGRRRPEVGR
ncbi:neocarzinostatin apoprotein domain-containing protein [Nocardioides sp. W7]|uniref:neocarzinostatin apoprotein domain-containing protein n=1 Tax=Nocardioides sp. W7 TaxID=2931390 RepID=UPI001FD1CB09|nr:neocarzinostatin apoprotein domain-containing protein [Nocardioides sp. W7]